MSGGTVDLGVLPGATGPSDYSNAYGISADASAIVGVAGSPALASPTVAGGLTAFRYTTADGVMRDLGTLSGPLADASSVSVAYATNQDGSVVVGGSTFGTPGSLPFHENPLHAFQWVETSGTNDGVMTDIDGRPNGGSAAYAVNADGSVIVGAAEDDADFAFGSAIHPYAFRWTQGSGLVDIGRLPGDNAAEANAVSADGNIVVGTSDPSMVFPVNQPNTNVQNSRAFRWTQATGMQSLTTLLGAAGVDVTGADFETANAITADGQYIAGSGVFPSTPSGSLDAYIARYCDAENMSACTGGTGGGGGTGPIGGITTPDSIQASVDQLQTEQNRLLVQNRSYLSVIAGDFDRLVAPDDLHVAVEAGSLAAAMRGRWNADNGLTLLGGVLAGTEEYSGVSSGTTLAGSLALRYVFPQDLPQLNARPFAEIGGLVASTGSLSFTRSYMNGAGTATGAGTTSGTLGALWGRGGLIWDVDPDDELGAYGELGYEGQSVGGYTEAMTATDPFNATIGASSGGMQVAKLGIRYSHDPAHGWSYGGGLAVAHSFGSSQSLGATVAGVGAVTAGPVGDQTWLEYGARVGYAFDPHRQLSAFVSGIAGSSAVGSAAHVGLDYRYSF